MTLIEQIEEMRRRMRENHESDIALIRRLDQGLYACDSELRAEIQHITMQVDARRAAIVRAIDDLAARIGYFPSLDAARVMAPPLKRHTLLGNE